MNLDEIKKLIKIFERSEIGELEIVEDNYKIRMLKNNSVFLNNQNVNGPGSTYIVSPSSPSLISEQNITAHSAAKEETTEKKDLENEKYHEVRSPMVGTFYRSPSPDSDPFIEIGNSVQKGDTLCIIEAMKLMNEIQADIGGKIVKILVENAQPVEYNQILFLVEKD